MSRITGFLLALCLLFSCCGCTARTNRTSPENALFCENIADQVQSVEQLHVASGTTSPPDNSTSSTRLNYDTIYAMWFAVMDYADTLSGKSESEFREIMCQRFQNAADMGINTVYLHVRAYQDAYYRSELFPMGNYADTDISYDPLEIMLEEAHALHLSAHAWINPMRGPGDETMAAMDDCYIIKQWYNDPTKNGTYMVKVGNNWWLNPAYPEVRQFIADGVKEIITQYDVDGIHLDDYFYPTTEASFDTAAFVESGASDLSAFRLKQTNAMVKQLYDTVKAEDAQLIVSISPQGTMHGNYDSQYADVRRWASTPGYCDVLIPQVYFGFENETAPFEETASLWAETVTCEDVSLVIGIGTHKLGKEDTWAGSGSGEWQEHLDIPQRQVELLLHMDNVNGIAIYDYDTTFCPETAADAMAQQVEEIGKLLRD